MNQEKIGKYILNLRKKNNMSQAQFAAVLNVTSQAVSKWENGRGIPDVEILREMSKKFNVNIESILDGEEKKNISKKIMIIGIFLILIIISIFVFFKQDKSFNLSDVQSDNELFEVSGVAAYQEDKKSIHINKLEIDDESEELYVIKECTLYEKEKDLTAKIVDCSKVEKMDEYSELEAKKLSDLLDGAEFHKDNYLSICEDLSNANLYISLKLLDENNNVITHEIPLKFNYSCEVN